MKTWRRPGRRWFWHRLVNEVDQHVAQFIDALSCRCNNLANTDAVQVRNQCVQIDDHAAGFGGIRHRQRDNDGPLEIQQLLHQVQALVKVGRIDDRENGVRWLSTLHATEDHIDSDLFFE